MSELRDGRGVTYSRSDIGSFVRIYAQIVQFHIFGVSFLEQRPIATPNGTYEEPWSTGHHLINGAKYRSIRIDNFGFVHGNQQTLTVKLGRGASVVEHFE